MGEHTWATRMGIEHCTTCGTCRRADGRNEPCRGKLPPIKPRRLIGWRVRYEWLSNGRVWAEQSTSTMPRLMARICAKDLKSYGAARVRNVRVMRVYRRRTR